MTTIFLEPGGDADFLVGTTNGFWGATVGTAPTIATDFVHGSHVKSIKYGINVGSQVRSPAATLADAGSRISIYFYFNVLPSATANVFLLQTSGGTGVVSCRITSTGILQLWNNNATAQIGTDGATLNIGNWYRISLAYTITSTTVNRFELFKDGVSTISITNATITNTVSDRLLIGPLAPGNSTYDFRSSDHYIDNSSSLTDPGNIWVTAKRPVSNGSANNFTTQIGAGGSGYGTGHSPQVNERPLSVTNGWSMVGAGSNVTEEYTIEGKTIGDINISGAKMVDFLGWISASSLVGETASIVVAGSSSNISLTNTNTVFTKIAGSTTYPAGGTDIGIITSTTLTTVSLYECGIMVAFIPANTNFFSLF